MKINLEILQAPVLKVLTSNKVYLVGIVQTF